MQSKLIEFLRSRGAVCAGDSYAVLRHCGQASRGNPMACVHGQSHVTVLTLDTGLEKTMAAVGTYSPLEYGQAAVLRHPEIIYSMCGHCAVPVAYIDDVNGISIKLRTHGMDAINDAEDAFLAKIRKLNIQTISVEMPVIIA